MRSFPFKNVFTIQAPHIKPALFAAVVMMLPMRLAAEQGETRQIEHTVTGSAADSHERARAGSETLEKKTYSTSIYFDFDSHSLSKDAVQTLKQLNPTGASKATVTILGHTDSVGSDTYNKALSERRARTVHSTLESMNLFAELNSSSQGLGENQPKRSNDSDWGRSRNRRAEITVTVSYPSPQAGTSEPRLSSEPAR